MRKKKEQKNKLSHFVILSIIFHVLLFGFMIFGVLDQIVKSVGGDQESEVVDAIMVDPGVVIKSYNQLQPQQNSAKQSGAEQKKRLQQQEEGFRKQQEEEQNRLKVIEQERIKVERETEQQHKQAEEAIVKAKAKVEQEQSMKVQAEAKAKTKKTTKVLTAKKIADTAKHIAAVNSLLGELTAQQPTYQTRSAVATGQGGNRKSGASNSDIANYASKIKAAIESKFYDADIYRGKTCELSIKLAPDGMLISITVKSNTASDQPLCNAAVRAAKTATMPKPLSHSIYDAFNEHGSTLVFRP